MGHIAWGISIDLPGVSDFNYTKNGLQIVENLDKVLKIVNPNPVEGLIPKVSVTFNETSSQTSLIVSGGNFGTPDQTQTFAVGGEFWTFNFGVTQDAAAIVGDDDVAISGAWQHIKGPHASDGLGPTIRFASNFPGASAGFSTHMTNGDQDTFDIRLGGTVKEIFIPIIGTVISTDITAWTFTADATHIPEPSTIFLLGSGVAGIMISRGLGFRRKG